MEMEKQRRVRYNLEVSRARAIASKWPVKKIIVRGIHRQLLFVHYEKGQQSASHQLDSRRMPAGKYLGEW